MVNKEQGLERCQRYEMVDMSPYLRVGVEQGPQIRSQSTLLLPCNGTTSVSPKTSLRKTKNHCPSCGPRSN